jgi:hypothetical protein
MTRQAREDPRQGLSAGLWFSPENGFALELHLR